MRVIYSVVIRKNLLLKDLAYGVDTATQIQYRLSHFITKSLSPRCVTLNRPYTVSKQRLAKHDLIINSHRTGPRYWSACKSGQSFKVENCYNTGSRRRKKNFFFCHKPAISLDSNCITMSDGRLSQDLSSPGFDPEHCKCVSASCLKLSKKSKFGQYHNSEFPIFYKGF